MKREKKEEERQLQLSSPELVQTENNLLEKPLDTKAEKKTKVEKMSSAGVGNVVAGNALYDIVKGISKLGQKDENKPATNGNLWELYDMLKQNQQLIIDLILKQEKEFKADDFI
ncbi:MAG: hypothetical protein PSN34_09330 [Urechidicola sp.]|nr:hypothetical protein [Urechidicola sp.]